MSPWGTGQDLLSPNGNFIVRRARFQEEKQSSWAQDVIREGRPHAAETSGLGFLTQATQCSKKSAGRVCVRSV